MAFDCIYMIRQKIYSLIPKTDTLTTPYSLRIKRDFAEEFFSFFTVMYFRLMVSQFNCVSPKFEISFQFFRLKSINVYTLKT